MKYVLIFVILSLLICCIKSDSLVEEIKDGKLVSEKHKEMGKPLLVVSIYETHLNLLPHVEGMAKKLQGLANVVFQKMEKGKNVPIFDVPNQYDDAIVINMVDINNVQDVYLYDDDFKNTAKVSQWIMAQLQKIGEKNLKKKDL